MKPHKFVNDEGKFNTKLVIGAIIGFMIGSSMVELSGGISKTLTSPLNLNKSLKIKLFGGRTLDLEPLVMGLMKTLIVVTVALVVTKLSFVKNDN